MKNNQDTWRFVVQVAFSSIVLFFCLYKLAVSGQEDRYQALYWGGVTGIMAWWMPSPGSGTGTPKDSADEQNPIVSAAIAKANDTLPELTPAQRQKAVQSISQRSA